jgi:hypothetical protein
MPWGDWQFWVVSLAAGVGLFALVRAVTPRKRAGGVRTGLTVERRKPRR